MNDDGLKLLDRRESKYNGTLTVYDEPGWGNVIYGGGLPQCGGLAKKIWELPLKTIKEKVDSIDSVLILGFGGGGIAQLLGELWPKAKITGVDIDKDMIELGEKYLGWPENTNVVVEDAEKFIDKAIKKGEKYDLICVDMYIQTDVPEKFKSVEFVENVNKLLRGVGLAVFNRLYGSHDGGNAKKFKEESLDKVFNRMKIVYPYANVMFICKKN